MNNILMRRFQAIPDLLLVRSRALGLPGLNSTKMVNLLGRRATKAISTSVLQKLRQKRERWNPRVNEWPLQGASHSYAQHFRGRWASLDEERGRHICETSNRSGTSPARRCREYCDIADSVLKQGICESWPDSIAAEGVWFIRSMPLQSCSYHRSIWSREAVQGHCGGSWPTMSFCAAFMFSTRRKVVAPS